MVTKEEKRVDKSSTKVAKPRTTRLGRNTELTRERTVAKKTAKRIDESTEALVEGARMPLAKLCDQDGKVVDLAELIGQPLVVYFYPKDDTPGCTREACSFQEYLGGLRKLKATVIGISADSVSRHRKFADKYGIKFPLLVDEDKSYMTKCGVIGEKVLYGKRSLGIIRTTFIVDQSGKIYRIFRKVKVDGHIDEVLTALKELK
jgi:peroxiredoxin Q/BCP